MTSHDPAAGEYWIDESGHAIYCDGDAGADVPNHNAVVISRCATLIVDAIEGDAAYPELADLLRRHVEDAIVDVISLRTAINDWSDAAYKQGRVPEEAFDDTFGWMRKHFGIEEWLTDAAFHSYDTGNDPRVVAVKRFGWIRVEGRNLDLPDLRQKTVDRLCDGLYDAYDDAWEEDADWVVSVWPTEKPKDTICYSGVPTSALQSAATIREHGARVF